MEVKGNLRFPLDIIYHGCPRISGGNACRIGFMSAAVHDRAQIHGYLPDIHRPGDASAGGSGRKENGVIGVGGHHDNAIEVLSGSEKWNQFPATIKKSTARADYPAPAVLKSQALILASRLKEIIGGAELNAVEFAFIAAFNFTVAVQVLDTEINRGNRAPDKVGMNGLEFLVDSIGDD